MKAVCKIKGVNVLIERDPSGSISIKGLKCANVKSGLKTIAEHQGISIEDNWNTRYLGTQIIKSLNGEKLVDNIISNERRLAEQFLSEDGNGDVEITHENIVKVEAMISYDSKYVRSGNKESGPDDKWKKAFGLDTNWSPFNEYDGYRGSSAFWMTRLYDFYFVKNAYGNVQKSTEDLFSFIIFNAVCAVDTENSTHINADGVGRIELSKRLINHQNDLVDLLKNDNKKYELIRILSSSTTPMESIIDPITKKETKYYSRNNFSFATKFCHYACLYLFQQVYTEYQDSYSIYDDVVANALKVRYTFEMPNPILLSNGDKDYSNSYRIYQDFIDDRIKESGENVSRNGFDHLFWYFYKGIGKLKKSNNVNKR